MTRKLVVFGLDGGTLDIINPLLEKGRMPNLKRLMRMGSWGTLYSTVPPLSPTAWMTIVTGLDPGQHGVFGWLKKMLFTGQRQVQLENGPKIIAGKTFWEVLDRKHGMRSFIMCVPMTYPAWPINGVLVAGLPGPDVHKGYVFPVEREAEYEGINPTSSYFKLHKSNKPEFVRIAHEMSRQRTGKAIEMLREGYQCVFFVLDATDAAHHLFWKYREPAPFSTDPDEVEKYGGVIDGHYTDFDEQLGKIIDEIDDQTTLIVLSDHGGGMSPLKTFNTNHWLEQNGFIRRKSEGALNRFFRKTIKFIEGHLVSQRIMKLVKYMPNFLSRKARSVSHGMDLVDFAQSKAFRVGMDDPNEGIEINLKGRQIEGIVPPEDYERVRDEIIGAILGAKDPETGKAIVLSAKKKEELYQGDKLDGSPDILLTFDPEYMGGNGIESLVEKRPLDGKLEGWPGTHRMNGIFFASGPNIKKNDGPIEANVRDITPTILHDMNVPVPNYMFGRVMTEIFTREFLDKNPVRREDIEYGSGEAPSEPQLSDEEKKSMEEKLRNLGYIE